MLKFINGQDYTQFDHGLFAELIQAQFPGVVINSEGDNPNAGTPGFVTVDLPESDHAAVLTILTTGLAAALTARKLEQARNAKRAAIQAEKARVRDGGVVLGGHRFDTDASAQIAYLQLAYKLVQTPGYSTSWKASEGDWVTMDAAVFAAMSVAVEAHIQTCFAWQAARDAEVATAFAAGDAAGIEAVSAVYS